MVKLRSREAQAIACGAEFNAPPALEPAPAPAPAPPPPPYKNNGEGSHKASMIG